MSQEDRRARWRKQIRELHAKLGSLLDSLEGYRPSFAGCLYRLQTRCGKPHCVCREGKLHLAWCLSFVHQGKRCLRSIPLRFLPQLEALTTRYKELRSLRANLTKTFAILIRTLDRLERSLRVPPARALPPRAMHKRR